MCKCLLMWIYVYVAGGAVKFTLFSFHRLRKFTLMDIHISDKLLYDNQHLNFQNIYLSDVPVSGNKNNKE